MVMAAGYSSWVTSAPEPGAQWGANERSPVQVSFEMSGHEKVRAYWRDLPLNIRRAAGWGAWRTSASVFAASEDMVPFRDGDLMQSGKLVSSQEPIDTSKFKSYDISYDESYAWKVHEETWMKFRQPGEELPGKPSIPSTRRGRQSKFLEKAMEEYAGKYKDLVAEEVNKRLEAHATSMRAVSNGPPKLVKKGTSSGGVSSTSSMPLPKVGKPPSKGFSSDEISEMFDASTESVFTGFD